jgi:hypothetical protein
MRNAGLARGECYLKSRFDNGPAESAYGIDGTQRRDGVRRLSGSALGNREEVFDMHDPAKSSGG